MLSTDAYAYLNIDDPICAWATYRGVLVTPPREPGFLSVWTAGLLGHGDPVRLNREFTLEDVRNKHFPDHVSRLRGMFCFLDRDSATKAGGWGCHFVPDCLAELSLVGAAPVRRKYDANWITYGKPDLHWAADYWRGIPYPDAEPIWETIVEGRFFVLGTDLRQRAYQRVKDEFPESLMILELARLAVFAESDFGNIAAFLRTEGDELKIEYYQDWTEAENPAFMMKIAGLREKGIAVNHFDLMQHMASDSFGNAPDLRPYERKLHFETNQDQN